MRLDGVPETLLALSVLIIALAILVLVVRKGLQSIHAKLGAVQIEVAAVNKAVNHVDPGTPSIPERLGVVERQVAWLVTGLGQLADGLGHELPPPPKAS